MARAQPCPGRDPAAPLAVVKAHRASTLLARRVAKALGPGGTGDLAHLVVVDGMTGAGKSCLAASLATALEDHQVPVAQLAVDDIVPGWDGLDAGVRACAQVLREVDAGKAGRARRWSWRQGLPGQWLEVGCPPGGVLLVEGSGALAAAAQELPDTWVLRVLVQAPASQRHAAISLRDPYQWDVAAWERQEQAQARRWNAPGSPYGPHVLVTR